jgi:TolQ protein
LREGVCAKARAFNEGEMMRIFSAHHRGSPWLRPSLVLIGGMAFLSLAIAAHAQAPGPSGARPANARNAAAPSATGSPAPTAAMEGGVPRQLDRNMSVWGMFMDAGSVAKSVMILLLCASIWNLTIFFEKSYVLRRVNRQADRFLQAFRNAKTLEDLSRGSVLLPGNAPGPMARMFQAGMQEYHMTADHGPSLVGDMRERIRERIGGTMGIVQSHETRTLGNQMSVLATIGSTAPFIGLFGTVWGIMTSFIGIAQTQTTNLAVVAPGIAEALLATAIGLAAAIPAVMLYNKFSRDIGTFAGRLDDFASEFSVVLSRELDRREVA